MVTVIKINFEGHLVSVVRVGSCQSSFQYFQPLTTAVEPIFRPIFSVFFLHLLRILQICSFSLSCGYCSLTHHSYSCLTEPLHNIYYFLPVFHTSSELRSCSSPFQTLTNDMLCIQSRRSYSIFLFKVPSDGVQLYCQRKESGKKPTTIV